MSLEQALLDNTVAVKALTEMLAKAGLLAANTQVYGAVAAQPEAAPAKKQKPAPAATESASTATTAVTADAPAKKEEVSEPVSETTTSASVPVRTADERSVILKNAVATKGRDVVVALLKEYGVARASEITDEAKLAEFDVKLDALVA